MTEGRGVALWRNILNVALAVLVITGCYYLASSAVITGTSRFFNTLSIIGSTVQPADEAVRLAPNDPEAHYTRALSLINSNRLDEAVSELKEATRLRPAHYYEWLDLGVTLDRLGDATGAERALRESVRLAPFFAQPHWQLGNFLYRQGRFDESFVDLRKAVDSNPRLFANLIDLAWAATDENEAVFESLVQPKSARNHLELAYFLAKQQHAAEAARQVKAAGAVSDEESSYFLRLTIAQLITNEQYSDAHVAWAASHGGSADPKDGDGFVNGSFLEPVKHDDPGFGWQLPEVANVSLVIDPAGPTSGSRSLRVEFSGENVPESRPIYQILMVRPETRYSVSFVARSEGLVSGGPPAIVLADATDPTRILSSSEPLVAEGMSWTPYNVEFSTSAKTSAISVSLQRLRCTQSPCPVFGKLWVSGFRLQRQ